MGKILRPCWTHRGIPLNPVEKRVGNLFFNFGVFLCVPGLALGFHSQFEPMALTRLPGR